jgi:anti-sigma28 factor (negative regulator of flagellin synthesis)
MSNESKNNAGTSAKTNAVIASDGLANKKVEDQVKELGLSSVEAENLAEACDLKRKKKIAQLKEQYQKGELRAQASEEVAKKIIKKFDL